MEYQIGDFSVISRLSIKTLRYYHEIGLLQPTRIEAVSGYRFYDGGLLERVRMIQQLKALRFSLSEIGEILDGEDASAKIHAMMKTKLDELEREIEQAHSLRQRFEAALANPNFLFQNENEIIEKVVVEQWIASIRFKGAFEALSEKIPLLMGACGAAIAGAPFSLYYDDHPMEDDNDIEICVPIRAEVQHALVKSRMLPGGKVISILHEGYYDQISVSYQKMVDAMMDRGEMIVYPTREIYWIGGLDTGDKRTSAYETEIQFVVG